MKASFTTFAVWLCAAVAVRGLTLDALMQGTLADNPDIQTAKANLERAAGQRLIFRSVAFPDGTIGGVGGAQGGHRSGETGTKPFGFGYGSFTQPLFNMVIPPSFRRGNLEVLIAQQQLNVAVTEQLHGARLAYYTAVYNRGLKAFREAQLQRLEQNARGQESRYQAGLVDRGAFVAAEVQTRELDPRIDAAERAYQGALLKISEALGKDYAEYTTFPPPEGNLHYENFDVDLARATAEATEHRPDIELARLFVKAANEDQRIIEAAYYPAINIAIAGEYIPVSGVRRLQAQGSARRSDDILSSEVRLGGTYTWRVIDNGKVGGAVLKQKSVREINELMVQNMERDVARNLLQIRNDLNAIAVKQKALMSASAAANENSTTVAQNLAGGVGTQLEYRLAQNDLVDVETGLLSLAFRQRVDMAEWDRATGKYLQFVDESARNVR